MTIFSVQISARHMGTKGQIFHLLGRRRLSAAGVAGGPFASLLFERPGKQCETAGNLVLFFRKNTFSILGRTRMSREAALAQIAAARGSLSRDFIEGQVRKFQASYAVADWQTRASVLSEDVIFEDTVGVPPPAIGRDAAAEYFKLIISLNWHVEMTPREIIVMGNEAFVITQGAWAVIGDPPANLHLIHNFKFNDAGEICHVRIAYDDFCLE